MENPFRRKQFQPKQVKPKEDNCKIKIKNTSSGKQIEFSGKCSKEQLEMAKRNISDDSEDI